MMRQADFEAIVHACWQHFCRVQLVPFVLADFIQHQTQLSVGALVELSRSKQGIVILADRRAGAELAGAMFACPAANLSQEQVNDALAEMANIIAGHVKTRLAISDVLTSPLVLNHHALAQVKADLSIPSALQLGSSWVYVLLGPVNQLCPATIGEA